MSRTGERSPKSAPLVLACYLLGMAFIPKPTKRTVLSAATFFVLFWRTSPATPEMIEPGPVAVTNASTDVNVGEVLARMASMYATCRTYEDQGVSWAEFSGFTGHVSGRPF